MSEIDCANCGEPNAVCNWGDVMVCDECSHTLGGDLVGELQVRLDEARRGHRKERARAEKAEAERDEARSQAVWAKCGPYDRVGPACWSVVCPGGRVLGEYGWGKGFGRSFYTEADALVAGRAVPWWEVAQ